MKRYAAILTAAALFLQLSAGPVSALCKKLPTSSSAVLESSDPSDYENNQILTILRNGELKLLSCRDATELSQKLSELCADPQVALIQPNYTYTDTAALTADPLSERQWALKNSGGFTLEETSERFPVISDPFGMPAAPQQEIRQVVASFGIDINAAEGFQLYNGGRRPVTVALIDTGVDFSHAELSHSQWVNEDEIPGNGIDDDNNGYIDDVCGWNFYANTNQVYTGSDDVHGTHGAGTIAAAANNGIGIAGIVRGDQIRLMSLKALGGNDGSGTTASIIEAIRYAENNGASICNLSLGTSQNDMALYHTIADSSMLFIVASGNDGRNIDRFPCYPASYSLDNIISVANLNVDGRLHPTSNYGASSVDIAAPGTYILSTAPQNTYCYMTGTSMAAPMVTAAAAMVYSHFDQSSLADVKEILLSSATTLDSLHSRTASSGMLNLGAALSARTAPSKTDSSQTDPAQAEPGPQQPAPVEPPLKNAPSQPAESVPASQTPLYFRWERSWFFIIRSAAPRWGPF